MAASDKQVAAHWMKVVRQDKTIYVNPTGMMNKVRNMSATQKARIMRTTTLAGMKRLAKSDPTNFGYH